jgi:dienelactone hydrolase/RimJ/RimL family protein N-acetyltransferase
MCHDHDSAPPIDARGAVAGESLILTAADGARVGAFAAHPTTPGGLGVVVLPDVRGLAGFYRELALRLADHGHAAVAIDYYGRTAGVDARGADFRYLEHVAHLSRPTIQADVAAAVAYLRAPGARGACQAVFTLGFCLGGRIAWLAASAVNRLAGAIGFYGAPGLVGPYPDPGPTQLADRLRAPILAFMGGADDGIPPADVDAFHAALAAAGIEHEIVVYPGAPHGFFDVKHAEHAEACADAWQRTLAFIDDHDDDDANPSAPCGTASTDEAIDPHSGFPRDPRNAEMPFNELGQPVGAGVPGWAPRPQPEALKLTGRFCRLERLNAKRHAAELFAADRLDATGASWTYLPYGPFADLDSYLRWVDEAAAADDPRFYAIIDTDPCSSMETAGRAVGVLSLLRIQPQAGSVEVGHVHYSPLLQRRRGATEAQLLLIRYALDELGYRRYEWKCDALNSASRAAAERLGFRYEGTFRQAQVVKGRNRDTAWFSILDTEWPPIAAAASAWLTAENFDHRGRQRTPLRART